MKPHITVFGIQATNCMCASMIPVWCRCAADITKCVGAHCFLDTVMYDTEVTKFGGLTWRNQ